MIRRLHGIEPRCWLLVVAALAPAAGLSAQGDTTAVRAAAGVAAVTGCEAPGALELGGIQGPFADVARLAEITGRTAAGPGFVRRWSDAPAVVVCGAVPWASRLGSGAVTGAGAVTAAELAAWGQPSLRILPVRSRTVLNTGYARDRNDGALHPGRGVSAELSGGVAVRWGVFSAAAAPELLYNGNRDHPLTGLGAQRIDLPGRVGTRAVALLDPGQSYARVDAYGAAVGVSTENLWLGPGLESSILLSSTAPGFPHVFAGTSRPVDVGIGRVDAEAFVGRLDESPFFDDDDDNDHRRLAGLVVGFAPAGAPGLHLGAARLVQRSDAEVEGSGDGRMGLTALYLRWVLPESGFEVVAEVARPDGEEDLQELVADPGRGRAFLIGLQKVFDLDDRWVRVRAEIANLNPTLTPERGITSGIYRSDVILQGHTHRGQLLGAWTGPGSDYQVVGGDLLAEWGAVGVFGQRVRRNVDIYFASPDLRRGKPNKHDVEVTAGTRATWLWRSVEVGAVIAYSHRRNRDFLPPDIEEFEQEYRVDSNWNVQLGMSWRPDLSRSTLPRP